MHFSTATSITAALLLAPYAIAAPVASSTASVSLVSTIKVDNIPQPSIGTSIERQAGGFLSNGAPPPPGGLHNDTITSFQLIKVNEDAEFVFFSELLSRIENGTFHVDKYGKKAKIVDAIMAIQAQELLHSANAAGALKSQGAFVPQPCEYFFNVSDFETAIKTADLFTDVVLSTLTDVQFHAATAGDVKIVPAVGGVIGQEGEQEGFFRSLLGKNPSESPFITGGARDFAWSALFQNFIVAGSCDPAIQQNVNLTVFEPLHTIGDVKTDLADSVLGFSIPTYDTLKGLAVGSGFWTQGAINTWQCSNGTAPASLPTAQQVSLVYLTGSQLPIAEPLLDWSVAGGSATFEAEFPFLSGNMSHGLTIGAVASGCKFVNADDVASKTLFGPALIEVG